MTATAGPSIAQSMIWSRCPFLRAKRNAASSSPIGVSSRHGSTGSETGLAPSSGGASVRTTTLVSCCGSQKTGASGDEISGSTGKSQPPPLPDSIGQRFGVSRVRGHSFKICVIGVVAAEPFPGQIGCGQPIQMVIFRRTPGRCIGGHRSLPSFSPGSWDIYDSRSG